jgi:argininosuccinate lyase
LADLSLADLQGACPQIEAGVFGVLGVANAVKALVSYGSGGRASVEQQLARWQERLGVTRGG